LTSVVSGVGDICGEFKKRVMRKGIIYAVILLLFAACSNEKKEEPRFKLIVEKAKGLYYLTLEGNNGDKTKQKVEFSINNVIVDSLKLSEQKIIYMCEDALRYSDWNVNYKPTYKHGESALLTFDSKEKKIIIFVDGTAENAYGVPDKISSTIPFNLKGKMINDKDGLPDILSY
jgi:hypothetical protein